MLVALALHSSVGDELIAKLTSGDNSLPFPRASSVQHPPAHADTMLSHVYTAIPHDTISIIFGPSHLLQERNSRTQLLYHLVNVGATGSRSRGVPFLGHVSSLSALLRFLSQPAPASLLSRPRRSGGWELDQLYSETVLDRTKCPSPVRNDFDRVQIDFVMRDVPHSVEVALFIRCAA